MVRLNLSTKTRLSINSSTIGETIETKFERILNNKEPIKDGVPLIHTERAEGVKPAYDIRTDRFEIAVMGMDKIDKSIKAKREEKAKMQVVKEEENGKTEPVGGTEQSTDGTN